jgi:hypothetical protein
MPAQWCDGCGADVSARGQRYEVRQERGRRSVSRVMLYCNRCGTDIVRALQQVRGTRRPPSRGRGRDPLWVRALEAWAEGEYPLGTLGRAAALRVVDEVRRHVRRYSVTPNGAR